MKTIKLLLCLVSISVGFYSCNDSDPIENPAVNTQQSIALRTALNEVKQANDAGRPAAKVAENPFCFEFVYPLSFSLNNGTVVTVSSFAGLLDIVLNESPNQYITGIAFPFSVLYQGSVSVISSEQQFTSLLIACGFNTLNEDLLHSFCFDLVFPITINQNGQTIVLQTMAQFEAYVSSPSNGIVNIVFPVMANYNGQQITINNLYELYQLINNCETCICTAEYAPVCVQTATGIVQFGNLCYAECAGYTQNDLVPCDGQPSCGISNLTVAVNNCYPANAYYQITLDFDATVATSNTFNVVVNNQAMGTYPFSALPLTLNVYYTATGAAGSLTVNLSGTNCTASTQWELPGCNCVCPAVYDPVCVANPAGGTLQFSNACEAVCAGYSPNDFIVCTPMPFNFGNLLGSCFIIQLPVQIQHQGQLITANDNGTILQFWNPTQNPIPNFNYPITVNFGNLVVEVQNQAHFESLIATHCN